MSTLRLHATAMIVTMLIIIAGWSYLFAASPDQESMGETIAQRYSEAKFYFNQLNTSEALAKSYDSWEKGAQNFQRIYLADPKAEEAPACLFMLGQVHSHMFERFHNVADLDKAISSFKDLTRLFPDNRLADDSYYAMGLLYLNGKRDPAQAAEQLATVLREYSSGDMHPQATDLLKQLSKDHSVALPEVMVGNSSAPNKLSYILPVKYWSSDNYTRVVIMASGPVSYREELLAESANKPRRLYLDFQDSYIEPQYRKPLHIEDGLLRQIRTGQFSKDLVRVTLDIESIESYKIYSLPEPFRVVVDVRGKSGRSGQKTLARLRPVQTPAVPETPAVLETPAATAFTSPQDILKIPLETKKIVHNQKKYETAKSKESKVAKISSDGTAKRHAELPAFSLAQQLGLKIGRIVLDPGHGGKDPGATANGIQEKDIVLKFAKQLKPILEQQIGCEVVLTRESDSFISLEERTAIANTKNADVFLSLHLNAHPSPQVRGIETYYLNLSTNAEAMRVAAMENATSTNQMSDLQNILQDILQNSKIKESSRLAEQVHGALVAGVADSPFADLQNLGVKQAPFYVLIGAQMPSILIELAFVSNEQDARYLQTENFIDTMARQVVNGVHSYVNSTTARL